MKRQPPTLSEDSAYRRIIETLLESMFRREQATVITLLNVLFDAGSQTLIQNKVPTSFLRTIATPAAKLSKPVARKLGQYWVERKAPAIIAKWLYAQVHPEKELVIDVKAQAEVSQLDHASNLWPKVRELESQLRWRTRFYIASLIVFGVWNIAQ